MDSPCKKRIHLLDDTASRCDSSDRELIDEYRDEDRDERRKRNSRSFLFHSGHMDGSFALRSGSSSKNRHGEEVIPTTRKSLDDFQMLLAGGLKVCSPLRGDSLYDDLRIGAFGRRGKRENMEDRHEIFVEKPKVTQQLDLSDDKALQKTSPHAFFAVYDGHGGGACVDFITQHLHNYVESHPQFNNDPTTALREGILRTEREFNEVVIREDLDGMMGSCICAVLIHGGTLYAASVGDSQAILCRSGQYIKLTYPHTPLNIKERQRVLQIGGKIKENRLCHPTWNEKFVNIAVTRSIGDYYFKGTDYVKDKASGLIADPEIIKILLTEEDSFVFLASDGYWDVFSPQETVTLITQMNKLFTPSEICQHLTQSALQRSSTDNVTALLIILHSKI